MRSIGLLAWAVGLFAIGSTAHAYPLVGMTLQVGEALQGDASGRVESTIYVSQPVLDGWFLGGELGGSMEGYAAGVGCGTVDYDGPVIQLAVPCYQPTAAVH